MKIFLIFISKVILLVQLAEAQTNYCSTTLCQAGKQHIACQNSGNFASVCPTNANMVNMTNLRSLIVDMHNVRRNIIATGQLAGYLSAKKMATMQWSNELAIVASYNVKQCIMKHDACRNTPTFSKSGQNLGYLSYTGDKASLTNSAIIVQLINLWWGENKYANMNVINSYPSSWSGSDIGHFTVMAAERNVRVGCSAARYTDVNTHKFLLACNYATTNIVGNPIYTSGTTASGCTTGTNSARPGLCAAAEPYSGL